ncbi:hypothetical protein CHS0354_032972 [Potamilus streckersoni]|uniref:Reverse transcriptase zinc-binding domain-containing protein n=1 Tax=Potamilus streckersoni TaxID=2493646 RepID=A0AAE0VKH2_9BIVA|nr:hypothetical protein CHS0354_032972 [Potamilus streckersoni]
MEGTVVQCRVRQRSPKRPTWQAASTKEKPALVRKEVYLAKGKDRQVKAVSMRKQVYHILPTPTTWALTHDLNCKFCGRLEDFEHVLSSCSAILTEGRYL